MKNFEGNFTDKILLKFGTDVIILLKQILYTRARNNYFDGVIKDFMVCVVRRVHKKRKIHVLGC